ncbi:hypothetical protein [Erythrobacter sp. F6033]|uniref:hypothetical protein n=1 Tax=Erythrobacter sp. F6033 TaxID=2926401 RepID=UPI001FF464AD|nr:hypothetical protein [Erythrobacter sp. F6033]MCK0128485.1 hypothetical protein [Erythrobacter sp. F6033]
MKRLALASLPLAAVLTACGEQPSVPFNPLSCDQDADGQIACVVAAFSVTECGDMGIGGSMFRRSEEDGTFDHRSSFVANGKCIEDLRSRAENRGFTERENGQLVFEAENGYRERLIIGDADALQIGAFAWERIQE